MTVILASLICDTFIRQSISIGHPAFEVFDKPLISILSFNSYVYKYVKSILSF